MQTRTEDVQMRSPTAGDAARIWELVGRTPSLDRNSPYAYLLLCTHFAETGLVAYAGSDLIGFVLGYARPDDRATAFVWQVSVDERARGRGLGGRLLDTWFARCARLMDLRFLEATVAPSNEASRALFASFALRHGVRLREYAAFERGDFPDGVAHEREIAVRIGPVPLSNALAPFSSNAEPMRA